MIATTPTKVCCNSSVGVLITDAGGRLLMFTRPDGKGVAPVAGHIFDEHSSPADAAITETREEVGLTVTKLSVVTGGWRYNRCKRAPGRLGYGHEWVVTRADEWTGQLAPSARETRDVGWYTPGQIQDLADRTLQFALGPGVLPVSDWTQRPGLEAVWVRFLWEAGHVQMSAFHLAAIEGFSVLGVPQS